MLDAALRPIIGPPLNLAAKGFVRLGVPANAVTWVGFGIGMAAVPLLAFHAYIPALVLIAIRSLADGLDGAIARQTHVTDYGGFLDISLDFIFYAGVVFGMALGRPGEALFGAFLIWAFMTNGTTFLTYAILAAKHNVTTEIRGSKSLYYLGGLAEGTETLIVFVLFCLFPNWFPAISVIFGLMCVLTAVGRIMAAREAFGQDQAP